MARSGRADGSAKCEGDVSCRNLLDLALVGRAGRVVVDHSAALFPSRGYRVPPHASQPRRHSRHQHISWLYRYRLDCSADLGIHWRY